VTRCDEERDEFGHCPNNIQELLIGVLIERRRAEMHSGGIDYIQGELSRIYTLAETIAPEAESILT
jgi:hypothetical protein